MRSRRMRPTGACAAWLRRQGSPTAVSSGYGVRTGSSRIWSKRSKSRATRTSRPRWRTWLGSTSIHPTGRWSSASTKRAKSKPSTAQPGLPMKKGRAGTMTHDYKRNGTTTLFAALNMLDGKVIGTCMPRHRHREFLRFLKLIDQKTPADLDLHLIVDNYATHKTPAVKRWLKSHPRFHLHFTPTSASWLNMVERFFAEITRKRIRRSAFKSVAELKSAIMEYLENHNADPKPFIWTKSAAEILEKVARAKQVLESQH